MYSNIALPAINISTSEGSVCSLHTEFNNWHFKYSISIQNKQIFEHAYPSLALVKCLLLCHQNQDSCATLSYPVRNTQIPVQIHMMGGVDWLNELEVLPQRTKQRVNVVLYHGIDSW